MMGQIGRVVILYLAVGRGWIKSWSRWVGGSN